MAQRRVAQVTTTRREIDIMKEISTTLLPHPNIVRLEAVVESMDYIHLVCNATTR